ncbi:MAG: lysozyme [Gemmatimonadales bacterium]
MTQTISRRGLDHLVELEALRLMMYLDQGGYPTIGVGHLLTEEELRTGQLRIGEQVVAWRTRGLTEDQALRLLDQDLDWAEAAVRRLVTVPLSQAQFDALVSFTFNTGPTNLRKSTLLRRLNAGNYAAVPTQMRRWVFTGRPPIRSRGLENRREAEVALWQAAA